MIKFTKMEALGNDYVYIDATKINLDTNLIPKLATRLSDRHFGIGSDGLILILPSTIADFAMHIYNCDGSQAQMCGNGIRCVGKFVYEKKLTNKSSISIETLAGIKKLDLRIKSGKVNQITVDMGKPILEPSKIPVLSPQLQFKLQAADKLFDLTCVSMGNPHTVAIVDNLNNLDAEKYGKIIESDNNFPEKTNVEFIEILDKNTLKMKVYERGSGITMACGTGACASVVAATINKLVNTKEDIKVILPGGNLSIKYDKNVLMTGGANIVYEGEFDYKNFI